jgi:uncharacterized membrane protein YdjX (TVP38/TMEM64 family)
MSGMRLVGFFVLLTVVLCVPFLVWGEEWEVRYGVDAVREWLGGPGRQWGWVLAELLLVGDLVLPVPATAVMSGLGYVYGWLLGGVMAAAGSFLSGAVAYGLCRRFGERAARRLMGPEDFERGRRLFGGEAGGWLVAMSRCLPLMPEVVACMAGLSGMPARRFLVALGCGSVPLGFVFAAAGAAGQDDPMVALGLSAGIPVVLYLASRVVMKRRMK